MKKAIACLLAVCLLCSSGLTALAETFVFSFTITEYTGTDPANPPPTDEEGRLEAEEDADPQQLELVVTAPENYRQGQWSNEAPKFELALTSGGNPAELPEGYSFGFARTMDTKIEIYSLNSNIFQPYEDGEYKVQFLLLDAQGRRAIAGDTLYDLKLDFTPPLLVINVVNSAVMNVVASDAHSDIQSITVGKDQVAATQDNGQWKFSQTASKSISYTPGQIIVTDKAGNTVSNNATVSLYVLNASAAAGAMGALGAMNALSAMGSMGGFSFSGGGRGGSSRTVYHSKSTTPSIVAYNAVELNVENESMKKLKVGNETLDLELYHNPFLVTEEPERIHAGSFSASFGAWNGDASSHVDTLILTADEENEETSTWVFSGRVYKKLAASGIDYLVLRRGKDVTALSTAGFTAGIRYSMYRAAGLGSSEFEYAVSMSDSGFAMNVTVDGQTYPLTHDPDSEFYYYDVFTGTADQLHFSEG